MRGSLGIPGTGLSLTRLGNGKLGGFGAIIVAFLLLVIVSVQIIWLLIKIGFQVLFWTIRMLATAVGWVASLFMKRQESQPHRDAPKASGPRRKRRVQSD